MVADDVQVLEDGIGGPGVPGRLDDALLGRPQLYELPKLPAQETPPLLDVQDQGMGLVLGEDGDAAHAGIDAVRQGEIDDPELAAEGDGRLGAPTRELHESGAAPPGEDQGEGVAGESADEPRIGARHGNLPEWAKWPSMDWR